MNERIQELAYQSEDYADSIVDQGGEFHQAYTRKFAELLVRECVGLVNEQLQHNNPNDSLLALKIKEHFGVRE